MDTIQLTNEEYEKFLKIQEQYEKEKQKKYEAIKRYLKTEKGKEKNRFYAKRYYEKNKDRILEKRKSKL
jgi:hypothetical protein